MKQITCCNFYVDDDALKMTGYYLSDGGYILVWYQDINTSEMKNVPIYPSSEIFDQCWSYYNKDLY